jgi:molybdopterin-containing oxidoreductase family iron-sulfur binding subunit
MEPTDGPPKSKKDKNKPEFITRRSFLKGTTVGLLGMAGFAYAFKPLLDLEKVDLTLDEFLQKHYRELSPEEMEQILGDLEKRCENIYGVEPNISDVRPMDGVEFAYALNLSRCIGCRRCAHACLKENNQSRDADDDIQMSYIRVLELDNGSINIEHANHYYDPDKVPREGKYYMPVQCHQCRNAPCVKACPVQATWIQSDGVTVVDYNWCIGCRYCMAACPYFARRFNFSEPKLEPKQVNPNQAYLGNRIRPKGVVEKCTFCLQRTRKGQYPACMEVCPTGARVFGNLADENSEINHILRDKRIYVLKEEVGTLPRFYYFFDK